MVGRGKTAAWEKSSSECSGQRLRISNLFSTARISDFSGGISLGLVRLNLCGPVPALPKARNSINSSLSRFFQTSDARIWPSAYRFTPFLRVVKSACGQELRIHLPHGRRRKSACSDTGEVTFRTLRSFATAPKSRSGQIHAGQHEVLPALPDS